MIFKFALRDLMRHWRFCLFFIFNLCIGLTGFITLETFKNALQTHLQANAKQILAADIAVEARRELTEKELQAFEKIPAVSSSLVYDFFAMATAQDQSRLVSVMAVEANFPLYGAIELGSGHNRQPQAKSGAMAQAWVYSEVLEQFHLKVGDSIKLGQMNFQIADVVVKDSTQTFRAASMAPRIYIPLEQLKATGLIKFGSTFSKVWLFKLNESAAIATVKENIYKVIIDPAVRVETPETAGEDAGRQLNYLSDYLGLVTLVALFLSALGAAYLFRLYLQEKLKDIAILRSLGLRSQQALWIYLIQTFILGVVAIVVSFVLASSCFPFLTGFISKVLSFSLDLKLSPGVFLTGFVLAVFGSVFISLPFLLKIREVSVVQLFSEGHFQSYLGRPHTLAFLPALILFVWLSIYQSHSFNLGFGFSGGLALTLLILALLAWASLTLVTRWSWTKWTFKFAFLSLQRKKVSSLALFVSLALGVLLINILPQLKVTIQNSMGSAEGSALPSLFVFDIQEEQMEGLTNYFATQKLANFNTSAMVRARILKVNDQDYERKLDVKTYKTREEERDAHFRNRGVNLTYRAQISASEEIVEGQPFSVSAQPGPEGGGDGGRGIAELSVETRYAGRMGLKLGDIMTFDIQGVEIKGRIVNFRSVRWTSFQPNFFVVMQPGFLEEAPKTFIGSIPRLPNAEKLKLQHDLGQRYSNISIIDVDHLVADVLKVAEQMSLSLELMAWLSILAGYVVLFSIVRTQVQSRRWELNLLKILGAQSGDLKTYILIEILVVTLLASIMGAFLSLVGSGILSWKVFQMPLRIHWIWIFSSVIGVSLLSLLVAWFAARQVIQEKPYHILTDAD